jgi:hypothetical protein
MTTRKPKGELTRIALWIPTKHKQKLEEIHERIGILPSEQIRRAIQSYLLKQK